MWVVDGLDSRGIAISGGVPYVPTVASLQSQKYFSSCEIVLCKAPYDGHNVERDEPRSHQRELKAVTEIMTQVKSVFVDGIPPYWNEDRVKEHLKLYGEIERVVLDHNMPTAKRRDFGFVNFLLVTRQPCHALKV